MVKFILSILVSGTGPRSANDIRSVIAVAKKAELDMYKHAKDFDTYSDASTVKKRVSEFIRRSRNSSSWQSDKNFAARRRMIKLM
ncbi:hypothetical protein FisN_3Hu139 [Fistulifera solaris]|uniref:Uncharacterized protein n=1 Tax=Fistulifera solaris TaxID=1519565 RepID=A0A1Z5JP39_FISSO|nr:hypothetical protein FisN_3Hu139 [Fistulifera solaris]|eukprot:GAX15666.1 hypothetical protein FisN_3Hu139 [Fistulifera solaris]